MVAIVEEHQDVRQDGVPTDAELIRDSGADPRAFMPLVERHHRILYGYLARRVGPDVAEELVSETFARAFALRERFDTQRPDARPWLFGIATNLMRNHLRSEVRQMRAYARTGAQDVDHHDEAASDARLDASVHSPALAAAIAGLSAGDRDVLLMFAWGDLAYEEIAQALDIPVGTVRSRLNRARRQLRESLPELVAAADTASTERPHGGPQ
jgi:RNA polymerase sigma factor (sigma-70 family)